ncbi:exonuclease subunit SbcD [Cyanobacterium stanieri LEGE 03274]|uniref:Nuclease SbcCD subunit D n=1 Tax=Cyanobacterium stanieri LEGE 03274 TaxID=1828756 RepID=A0ABR9V6H2_9CHRO|nr:exonuclease subunit SbcD [Cyanobacterium stanieri]MBE9222439.1 exonuclease subunit SbcD [Cyanobacterium stanieri LEGE 03274]
MKILHLSDIHLGSSFNHGKINNETGLNTRYHDFIHSLSICMDRAISESVDLVLFGGDAFPDSTPAPYLQSAFASEFRRLGDAGIPTVLLVGNHDQHGHNNKGVANASLSIYHSLGVPDIIVGEKLETHHIKTKSGMVQVITLPWLTRSVLLTKKDTVGLSMEQINRLLIQRVETALEGEVRALDNSLPTILLGHLMAERSQIGAERHLSVGKGFQIPLSMLIRPEFDFVALGHVHRHQNLNLRNNPPVVYPGSIERVDFSEEKEEKGYVLIDIDGERGVSWEFCGLPARRFCTIEVDCSQGDDPLTKILGAIASNPIEDAVVRLIYKVRSEQVEEIKNKLLVEALSSAHTYTIRAELVSVESRSRLPELGVGNNLDPYGALSTYLENREDIQDIADDMLAAAQNLLAQIP